MMRKFFDCTQDTPAKVFLSRAKTLYNDLYEDGYYTVADRLESVIDDLESEIEFLRDEYLTHGYMDLNINTGIHP